MLFFLLLHRKIKVHLQFKQKKNNIEEKNSRKKRKKISLLYI